ncbi:hypothetical protein HPB47_013248, partial [Ixodes persulcatus]
MNLEAEWAVPEAAYSRAAMASSSRPWRSGQRLKFAQTPQAAFDKIKSTEEYAEDEGTLRLRRGLRAPSRIAKPKSKLASKDTRHLAAKGRKILECNSATNRHADPAVKAAAAATESRKQGNRVIVVQLPPPQAETSIDTTSTESHPPDRAPPRPPDTTTDTSSPADSEPPQGPPPQAHMSRDTTSRDAGQTTQAPPYTSLQSDHISKLIRRELEAMFPVNTFTRPTEQQEPVLPVSAVQALIRQKINRIH